MKHIMKKKTVARLLALNKQFYQTFGHEFSSTRLRLQPGVLRMLDSLAGNESILDLGCGNGEIARELMRRGHRGRYTGVDLSPTLLEVARHGWEDAPATFLCADLASADWDKEIVASQLQPFDMVTAFATLHHIPGQEMRIILLDKVHALLKTGGRFVHSEWQFMNSEKLKKRIQPWREAGIASEDVDDGDALLDWRSGGRGLRYVHHFNEAELQVLAGASHFRVGVTFYSDGADGRLGLYQVWEPIT
jgi:tRNA (uracil-5-)-methyltransferase TRM9